MDWLKSNLDYLLFSFICLGLFALKHLWMQRTGRRSYALGIEWVFVLAVLAGGWFFVNAAGEAQYTNMKAMVQGLAPTYAQELELMGHARITEKTAKNDPTYLALIQAQIRWEKANPTVHDIYTLRKLPDGKNVFIVDSETDYDRDGKFEGKRESRTDIGELYDESDPGLERGFRGQANFEATPVTDRWGSWVSAFEPMRDSTGRVEAVLRVGYDASAWATAMQQSRTTVMVFLAALQLVIATFCGVIGMMRGQLSERELAEEALRGSEQKLRLHIEQNPMAVIEFNSNFEVVEWNPAAERIFGYSLGEIKGRSIIDTIVPETARAHVQNVCVDLITQKGGRLSTNDNITKDGKIIRCEWSNAPLLDKDGNVVGITSLCEDVTERQRVATEIENLAAFPRLNPNPIMQFAADGKLVYFNDAAQQMAKSVGKEAIADILPEDTVSIVKECIATGNDKLKRETKIANRTISWSFFPIAAIRSVHCYASEITERLNLEQQLRQSTKMQSVGQLAAGVAHDFNNILTIIQGHSELLSAKEKFSPNGVESLGQITIAAERAAKLTHQLLTFGRKQFMQVENLDLNEVIKRVTQMLRRVLGENITLRSNLTTRLPAIEADSTMMEQIIMNLAVNARDAMPSGGSLIIGTVPVNVTRAYVERNPEAREGSFISLSVSDNGTGIEQDKLSKLFEPFFTTKEVGKGTGLGLATVYGIVKQHQGWIEVESEVGKGTTFKIFLPANVKAIAAKNDKAAPKNVRGGKETILLVEDEPGVLTLARGVLKSYGYEVLEASSGVDALRVWAQFDTRIDLLLTDIVMPGGISGIELAKKLRQEKQDLKVVYSSGYSVEVAGQDFGLREGMSFLKKPYQPQKLAQMVRECLDSRA